MKTVFMGTPDFAAIVLGYLYESKNSVELVITQPDKARDRGKKIQMTPVKELALAHNTLVLQPSKIKESGETMDKLREIDPDVIIVAAYGQLLQKEILDLPKYGCINVHASLLPKLRGASPIQQAIVTGESTTGVTIMQMGEGLDTGDMLTREEVPIEGMTGGELHTRLAQVGGRLLCETLDKLVDGSITPEPQDSSRATYAGLIEKKHGKIDFNKSPEEIERLIRGFDPWPGAFCQYNNQPLKLWKAIATEESASHQPGTVVATGPEGIKVVCGGRILIVTELQVPGKKRTLVSEFLKGHKLEAGTIFQ